MKPEIEAYIIKNYQQLRKDCRNITKNSDWSDDLLNEVILQLYDKENIKLDKLDDNNIKHYIIRVICNNWNSKTSPFYRKIKRESDLYSEMYVMEDKADDDKAEAEHTFISLVEQEFGALGWFHKDIFSRYMVLGSYKRVSEQTTIPIMSIGRYVNEAKQEIKININKKLD